MSRLHLEDIIGRKCSVFYGEDEWTNENSIICKVIDIRLDIEDKFPFNLIVSVCVLPIGKHNLDDDDLFCMQCEGVGLDSVIFNI
tara:strand:+ start:1256 stop:1510 length:255 start_codon:yes stop_codon:yes gene_type:complete